MAEPFAAKVIQEWLGVEQDGKWGERTELAARAKLKNPLDNTGRPWSSKRLIYGVQQAMLKELGYPVTVDGILGPETLDALERHQNGIKADAPKVAKAELSFWSKIKEWWWGDEAKEDHTGAKVPVIAPKPKEPEVAAPAVIKVKPKLQMNKWPLQRDVDTFFGAKGENQVRITLPYEMKIAWDKKQVVKTMVCHRKVAPSVLRVLEAVKDHYGPDEIQKLGLDLYGGCLNVRKVRGGNTWSMHSWGIAIDFDPDRNAFRDDHTKARLAKDDAKAFLEFWEAEGWLSLGRYADYDWMHVQAARIK